MRWVRAVGYAGARVLHNALENILVINKIISDEVEIYNSFEML